MKVLTSVKVAHLSAAFAWLMIALAALVFSLPVIIQLYQTMQEPLIYMKAESIEEAAPPPPVQPLYDVARPPPD
jgi:ABC-type molybdate transport system permease subunit